jgi:hypothetical protein
LAFVGSDGGPDSVLCAVGGRAGGTISSRESIGQGFGLASALD